MNLSFSQYLYKVYVKNTINLSCCISYKYCEKRKMTSEKKKTDVESLLDIVNIMEWEENVSIHCGKVPVQDNYHFTHRSIYALSPQGCGVACHRFWECIYLNTIPIVLRTNTVFDNLFQLTYGYANATCDPI